MNDIHIKGLPSPQRMVFASGESPPSEWDSPARRFPPFPGGSLLQVNDIHLKGLPLSTANGICFRGVPSSKRMVFSSRGFPLHSEWDLLQRIPLVNSEWNSHQLRTPSKRSGFAPRGSPSPKRMGFTSRGSPSEWDSLLTSGLVAARDPFQGILLRGHATQGIPFSKGLRLCV